MQRRGDQHSFIIAVVIILLTFFVALAIYIQTGAMASSDYDLRACQLSLTLQANTKFAGVVNSPFTIDCPRRILTVTDTKTLAQKQNSKVPAAPLTYYTPDPKNQTKLVIGLTYTSLTDNIMDSILAESMRRCWLIGEEGKQPIFNAPRTFERHTVCMICDQIDFRASSDELSSGAILSSYLINTKMPNSNPSITYDQYLFTPTTLQGSYYTTGSDNNADSGFTLSTGKDCLVTKDIEENPDMSTGTYATVLFRWFAGNDKGCMTTYVVPASKLRSLCEYIAN